MKINHFDQAEKLTPKTKNPVWPGRDGVSIH